MSTKHPNPLRRHLQVEAEAALRPEPPHIAFIDAVLEATCRDEPIEMQGGGGGGEKETGLHHFHQAAVPAFLVLMMRIA